MGTKEKRKKDHLKNTKDEKRSKGKEKKTREGAEESVRRKTTTAEEWRERGRDRQTNKQNMGRKCSLKTIKCLSCG